MNEIGLILLAVSTGIIIFGTQYTFSKYYGESSSFTRRSSGGKKSKQKILKKNNKSKK